jgi:galactose mutarotase-like enzyme
MNVFVPKNYKYIPNLKKNLGHWNIISFVRFRSYMYLNNLQNQIVSVDGAPLDFRKPKSLRDGQGNPLGVDNSLVFESTRNIEEPAAMLASPDGAVTLKLWTDQPGLHGI